MSKRIICKHIDQQLDHIAWDSYASVHCGDHNILRPAYIYILTKLMSSRSHCHLIGCKSRNIQYLIQLGFIMEDYSGRNSFSLNSLGYMFVEKYLPHYRLLHLVTFPSVIFSKSLIGFMGFIGVITFYDSVGSLLESASAGSRLNGITDLFISTVMLSFAFCGKIFSSGRHFRFLTRGATKANFIRFLTNNYDLYQNWSISRYSTVEDLVEYRMFT